MCGIVGYVGNRDASEILVAGLRRLEYRGYDSAGLATMNGSGLEVRRTVGRVSVLAERLNEAPVKGQLGIAHTRWATHGQPTIKNAHPHLDASGRIAVVHNGIIENYKSIRTLLTEQGIEFQSDTDTESLAQLIGYLYAKTGDVLESVRHALREIVGSFGVAVLCSEAPQTLIAARRGSPVIVGIGKDEFFISSDANSLVSHTSQVVYLDDNEIVCLGQEGMSVSTIDAKPVQKQVEALEITLDAMELGQFEHHMLKEIEEQPESLLNAARGRIDLRNERIVLGGLQSLARELPRCKRVLLFGCGTAWHAALVAEYLFEELAGVPTDVDYASELRYRNPLIQEGTLAIAISQSGETADTLAALREVKMRGATVIGVVNEVGSSIARETDAGVYLHIGPEIGVASTKAFTAQLEVLTMIAIDLGRRRHLSSERTNELLKELTEIPKKVEFTLDLSPQIRALAAELIDRENWLYLGRGVNFPVALEGALKLKEVSYIHAEGLPAAEMKHGPIAMIDPGMPVVVICPQDHTYEKVLANIEEVCSRRGRVIAVATEGDRRVRELAETVLYVPATDALLSPLVTSIPLQLLAYHCAVLRGHDVDKPRNLAKSVTVE